MSASESAKDIANVRLGPDASQRIRAYGVYGAIFF